MYNPYFLSKALNHNMDYGKLDIYRLSERDGFGVTLSWKHGANYYSVRAEIDRMVVTRDEIELIKVVRELEKRRRDRVEQVKYWTNCEELA